MLKKPFLRHRGEKQVGMKKPPGHKHWTTFTPSCRDAAWHPFTPTVVLPLARSAPLVESVAALPVVLIGANGVAAPCELYLPFPNVYRQRNRLRSVAC